MSQAPRAHSGAEQVQRPMLKVVHEESEPNATGAAATSSSLLDEIVRDARADAGGGAAGRGGREDHR